MMICFRLLYFIIIVILSPKLFQGKRSILNGHIKHYEGVNVVEKSSETQDFSGLRVAIKRLYFHGLGRTFNLLVKTGSPVLLPTAKITSYSSQGSVSFTGASVMRYMVNGIVIGNHSRSRVVGSWHKGEFDGVIEIDQDTYYVEAASKFFRRPVLYKSIIYRSKDCSGKFCQPTSRNRTRRATIADILRTDIRAHVLKSNQDEVSCSLKLIADHTYFQKATDRSASYTISEMQKPILSLTKIFERTDFDDDGNADGLSFHIKEIIMFRNQHSMNYRLYQEDLTASNYIKVLGEYSFVDVCMAIAFCYRNFADTTMGFALPAIYTGKTGGMCSPRQRIETFSTPRSLNSLVLTVFSRDNPDNRKFKLTIDLDLAYLMGIAYGADDDPENRKSCVPGPELGGRYIMTKPEMRDFGNNMDEYSICSRDKMKKVLLFKAKGCLVKQKPICGNSIIEVGEQCDCGNTLQCGTIDRCCTPSEGDSHHLGCTVRGGQFIKCSPTKDPCCTKTCVVTPRSVGKICNIDLNCQKPSYCDGVRSACPPSLNQRDGVYCKEKQGVCWKGECKEIVCSSRQMESCDCDEFENACKVCCRLRDKCQKASVYGIISDDKQEILRPLGDKCWNDLGYCSDGVCNLKPGLLPEAAPPRAAPPERGLPIYMMLAIVFLVIFVFCLISMCLYLCTPLGNYFHKKREQKFGKA